MRKKRLFFLLVLVCLGILFRIQGRIETISANTTQAKPSLHSTLTVVTYNIRGGRDDYGNADALAIADELRKLGADIIALQEVDNGLPRSGFVDQAQTIAAALHMNYVFAPAINFLVGTYGNAVVSRYPIVSSSSAALPYHLEPRALMEVELIVDGQAVRVFNTHLGLKHSERTEQFAFLYDYLRDHTGATAIFLGDFNTRSEDPLLTPLRTLFQDPLFKRKKRLLTINGKETHGMIDHIFHSPDLQFVDAYAPTTGRSDHYPVIVQLKLPKKAWP
jgi:endonuclease/exonuclease/phosphatase family metal-dependent hydrolase